MRGVKTIVASFTGLVLLAGMGGCAAQPQQAVVPATARLQVSSSGQKVYAAPAEGTMYVYDQPADRLIWSGQVKPGQVVGVDPARNEVTLNGTPVSNKLQVGNGRIDILFEPSPAAQTASGVTSTPSRTTTSGDGTATVTGSGSYTVQPPPVTVTPTVRVEQQPVPAGSVVTPTPSADPGK